MIAIAGIGIVAVAPSSWTLFGWGLVGIALLAGLTRAFVLPSHVTSWETGGAGERGKAALLTPLEREGFRVLHDRRIPQSGANIDHIVVGPTGVWVVETKSYAGEVRVRGGRLTVGGRRKDAFIDEVGREQAAVAVAIGGLIVTPVIVIHRAQFPLIRAVEVGSVRVLPPRTLADHIRRAPVTLAPAQVGEIAARLDAALPPAFRQ